MFSPVSSQKRKRVERVVTVGVSPAEGEDGDDSAIVLRPKGKIHHFDASYGRIYRNGDFLSINNDQNKFLLYRDVLHTLNPSKSQFDTLHSTASSFSNFRHEICYAIDAQGERTIIGCSPRGEVFFASPSGGIYAESQLECCKDLSDEVSTICAITLESSVAIVVGTKRGELYLVGCPRGSTQLFAVGPLSPPGQPLLLGLVESGVKMLGFGLSGLGFGAGAVASAAVGGAGRDAVRRLYGEQGGEQVLKLLSVTGEGTAEGEEGKEGGHVISVSPSVLSLWTTSSSSSLGDTEQTSATGAGLHQWAGQCLAEHNLAGLLSQDVSTQLRGKVTSKRDAEITNRDFVMVDVMLYQYTTAVFPVVVSLAILSLAPSPSSSSTSTSSSTGPWELWLHLVEMPLASAPTVGEGTKVRLRRRVAFLQQPASSSAPSKPLLPEIFRKERNNESDSLFITWFNGINHTGDENANSTAAAASPASDHLSFHALEVVDLEQYCPDVNSGQTSEEDDSGAYLEYLHLHATSVSTVGGGGNRGNQWSCLAEGVVTGVPLAAADISQRPFLTVNVVASLNNTAYSSGRNRATQSVSSNSLPIYELTLVWRDGALFSCVPPKASSLQLYTTCKVGAMEQQLTPEEVIIQFIRSEGKMSENQCFTALVKATSGTSRANANGKLLNRAGAVSIMEGALAVSSQILNQRELSTTSSSVGVGGSAGASSSDLLSHRLLMEKKQKHDQLFPLMHAVLDNSNAGDLNLLELSWHRTLLVGSLVLSTHMRDVRLYGDVAPSSTDNRGGENRSGRFSQSQSLSQGKKRDRLSESSLLDQDGFLSAVQRGIEQVLPPTESETNDMPGRSSEDIFFAHPFLLPVGLYRIAKEIETRHEMARGQSNHTVLATTCSFLSLLLSVIQAPKVTDFSLPVTNIEDSGRKRVAAASTARQSKRISQDEVTIDHIEDDACCLALASEHNIRAASYICLRVLEDCISINFNDEFGTSLLRDGVQSHLDTKRLYKLVHIVLFGYENETTLALRGESTGGGRGGDASSPPTKRGGAKISGGKKNGKDYANRVEQCHLFKKCGVSVFFASNKREEAYTLSSRFGYFEGMCRAAFEEEGAYGTSVIGLQRDLRTKLETVLRGTLSSLNNDLVGFVEPVPLQEVTLSQFVLSWLEEQSRFSTLLEVGECMHSDCMQTFLQPRPYLNWLYCLKKKDHMAAALHSFGYTQFDHLSQSHGDGQGFAHLLPKVSAKAVEMLHHLPPAAACRQGPRVSSTRCAKSLLSVSKLCAWATRLEEGEQQTQGEEEVKQASTATATALATISAENVFDMNKKALLSIRVQEFLKEYSGGIGQLSAQASSTTARGDTESQVYQRTTPDVLVQRLLGLVQGDVVIAPEVQFSCLSLALGVLNLNKESYLEADEPSSAKEWYSLVTSLWCASMTSDSEKWLQLASCDNKDVLAHEELLQTTDLYYLLREVAGDPCVNLLRDSILAPNRAVAIIDNLIKHLKVSPDKKNRLAGFLLKCVQLAISEI